MARNENPPFQRGETFYGGDTPDANNLLGGHLLGKEWLFEDRSPSSLSLRSNHYVRCRLVRNTSGMALTPKRLVKLSAVAGEVGNAVDGYATVTADECYAVDEYLPSAGVVDDDIFWIVVDGPALVTVGLTAGANTNIPLGGWVVSQTAATSGATTAGRVENQVLTGSSQATDYEFLADAVQNRVGRAMTARTTANTGSDILVMVGKW